ncbi:Thyrotropin-releasing hormone receptor [Araneus ventricosus]|uniref:Thyrotropin-releasing hormone receptor n=1 Tax=Araneus ventricosus TaxID=182803 RepID=A0A4Y2J4F5_ARAVE|nr:Thyrotropin-releasing hormone receptor [Araneus ventricosus]
MEKWSKSTTLSSYISTRLYNFWCPDKEGKPFSVTAILDGTSQSQANKVFVTDEDWELTENISSLCFDTTDTLTLICSPVREPFEKVVKMLVVVVALFATLWFPYRFLVVYNSFATHRYMELWFLMFCKTMIFINSAINPILYNAMSIKFRKAFKRLLSCGK